MFNIFSFKLYIDEESGVCFPVQRHLKAGVRRCYSKYLQYSLANTCDGVSF